MARKLEIPDDTKRRQARVRDAAVEYIHQRKTDITALAARHGLNANYLGEVCRRDKWDDFVEVLRAESMLSCWDKPKFDLQRAQNELAAIEAEINVQRAHVEKLSSERDDVLKALEGLEPGTKAYGSAVSSYRALTEAIEAALGLDDYKAELSAARMLVIKKAASGDSPPSASDGSRVFDV